MRTITLCTVLSASILALTISPRAISKLSAPFEGPNPGLVSADAAWLVHIDVEQALQTRLGRLLFDAGRARLDFDAANIENEIGIDPMREIKRVTAYGLSTEGGPGVIILEATPALDRIIDELKAEHGDVTTELLEGYEILRWDQGVASIRATGGDRRMLVFGPEDETLLLALRVIDDAMPSLADVEHPVFNRSLRRGAFLSVQVPDAGVLRRKLADAAQDPPEMLRLTQAASLQLGEHEGISFLDSAFAVESDKDAQDIADVAQGLIAMGRLMLREEPDFAELEPIIRAITIHAEGPQVRIVFELPADQLPQPGGPGDDDASDGSPGSDNESKDDSPGGL